MNALEEAKKLEIEAEERRVWYSFWVSNKGYHCEANRLLIDQWLTDHLQSVTAESLQAALVALKETSKLAVRDLPRRPDVSASVAEVAASAEVGEVDPNPIPAEITRKIIIDMDKHSYRQLQKQYGNAWIENRVNRRVEEQ